MSELTDNDKEQNKMYAIIKTGGKHLKVKTGDIVEVEKLDVEVGSKVTFSEVLAVG